MKIYFQIRSRKRSNGFGKTAAKDQFFNAKAQSRKDFKKTDHFFALLGQKLHFCAKILFFFVPWRLCVKFCILQE